MIAGRQPAAVVLVDLVDMDYKVVVAETGIQPGKAHYRRVDMLLAGRYDTTRVRIMSSENHEKGDRTEGWRMMGSSPHSLRGRDPASR